MELDTVHHCTAAELLAALPDDSIDALLTDPPYGRTAIEWDDEPADMGKLWPQIKRVMKPGGVVAVFGTQPFTSHVVMSNLAQFRYEWIWSKTKGTGYLNANRNPMKSHENILIFYDQLGTYNPQKSAGRPYRATSGAAGGFVRDKTVAGHVTVNEDGKRYPTTVLKFASDGGLHPTQKPLALMEYLVLTYTNPGDVVLDPFGGSGTTAVAARNTERHYITCDNSLKYVQIMRKRLGEPFTKPMFK